MSDLLKKHKGKDNTLENWSHYFDDITAFPEDKPKTLKELDDFYKKHHTRLQVFFMMYPEYFFKFISDLLKNKMNEFAISLFLHDGLGKNIIVECGENVTKEFEEELDNAFIELLGEFKEANRVQEALVLLGKWGTILPNSENLKKILDGLDD